MSHTDKTTVSFHCLPFFWGRWCIRIIVDVPFLKGRLGILEDLLFEFHLILINANSLSVRGALDAHGKHKVVARDMFNVLSL